MTSDEKQDNAWSTAQGKRARRTAERRWGSAWAMLSEPQREAFVCRELVFLLLGQDEDHAHRQVRNLQNAAREALKGIE